MIKYEFTLVVEGSLKLTEGVADALFQAGCSDGTPRVCDGIFSIDFNREADSLEEAIRSAIANIKSVGYEVARVEMGAESVPEPADR
jgi:hypothetical protein